MFFQSQFFTIYVEYFSKESNFTALSQFLNQSFFGPKKGQIAETGPKKKKIVQY